MGGDRLSSRLSPISNVARVSAAPKLPISPLVGEMSGRTEGARRSATFARFDLPIASPVNP
ncbi:MAG: hypothetical protein E5W83_31530 [Mesorhizobium sp.]|nr:MAG: hypothetical protein E5W83_31530 [Mesorhizobium sp.]